MLTKSLGSIVLVTLLFFAFNTSVNADTEVVEHSETTYFCSGIIEIIQIGRTEVSMNVNEAPTTIRLVDANNTVVYQSVVQVTGLFEINVSSYDTGTYKLEAIHDGTTQTETIVLE